MKRVSFLDGIRGWGAFIVLIYHVFVDGFPLSQGAKHFLHQIFFFNGTLAVWLFFIVSGFSLSIGYAATGDRSILLRIAYGRYLRLALPVLFFSLLMYVALVSGTVPPVDERLDRFDRFFVEVPSLTHTVLFSVFGVFFNYDASKTLIPPLWTMPIEMLGSILVLSLCNFFGGRKWGFLAYIVAFSIAAKFAPYYAAFFAGVIFATLYARNLIPNLFWIPLLCFVAGAWLAMDLPEAGQGLYLVVSLLLFSGIICCKPVRDLFEYKVSRFLGRISFTLYLFHAIVLWSFTVPILTSLTQDGVQDTSAFFLLNVTTVVIAVVLSRLLVHVDEMAVLISRKFSKCIIQLHSSQEKIAE